MHLGRDSEVYIILYQNQFGDHYCLNFCIFIENDNIIIEAFQQLLLHQTSIIAMHYRAIIDPLPFLHINSMVIFVLIAYLA